MRPIIPYSAFLALICLCQSSLAQVPVDLDQAIDPLSLTITEVFEHLDTVSSYRTPIEITPWIQVFTPSSKLQIESFYQRSDQHHLLRLSEGSLAKMHTFAFTEGRGRTYLRISDNQCHFVITLNHQTGHEITSEVSTMNCSY